MELHARVSGNGPAAVLLHGLFGSNENLGHLARQLADTHTVLAPDLRNHGRSPHADAMDYPALATDVRDTLVAHGLDSATVIGHSLGGKVGMELALEQPGAVDRLVVLDIAPIAYRGVSVELEAMRSLDLASVGSRREADEALAAHVHDPGVRQFLLKNLARGDRGFSWRIPLETIAANADHIAAAPSAEGPYPGPALFVRGGRSKRITAEGETAIRNRFPQARIETVEEAGHWVHIEAPDATLHLIRRFLGEQNHG